MRTLCDLRVCFLAGVLGRGGAERQLFYMLKALRASRITVHVLSLTRGEFWEPHIRELGVDVIWVGSSRSRLRRLGEVVQQLRRLRPHIVQSQHFFANAYAALAARWTGVREIGAIRSNTRYELYMNGPLLGALNLRLPRTIVANSHAAIENAAALKIPRNRLLFLGNVVDTDQFIPAPPRSVSGPVRLLTVGRCVEAKRYDVLLQAFARVRRVFPDIRLTLAGGGALEGMLKDLASSLSIAAAVDFRGPVEPSEVASLYANSDVFVLSSSYEGTPNVLLEAMAAGLPVVSTAAGGVCEIVEDQVTGLLTPPGNSDALADALLHLASKASVRSALGSAARRFVEQRHSVNSLPAELERIYHAALA